MLVMFVSGLVVGVLLDLFRVIQDRLQTARRLNALFDLVFWLLSALLVFSLLWWSNGGELRFYVFVVIGFGFFLYLHFLSERIRNILARIVGWLARIVKLILFLLDRIVWNPLRKIVMILSSILLFPYSVMKDWIHKNREKK